MLVIRFFRIGKKNQPSFKIIITDKRRPTRAGRFVEEVGFWNPVTKEKVLKTERIKYWLSVGAKPSASIYNLLVSEKILEGKKIPVHKKSKKKEPTSAEAATAKEKPAVAETSTSVAEVPAEKPAVKEKKPAEEKKVEEKAPEKPAEKTPEEKKSEEAKPIAEAKAEAKTEEKPAKKTEPKKE